MEVPGLERLRLSSLEPQHVTPRLLEALAHPLVARHLHLPLQSADDGVLRDMRGRTPTVGISIGWRWSAPRMPDVIVTTDVIVGFPRETRQAAFERTLTAIGRDGLFGRVHVFTFSPRARVRRGGAHAASGR